MVLEGCWPGCLGERGACAEGQWDRPLCTCAVPGAARREACRACSRSDTEAVCTSPVWVWGVQKAAAGKYRPTGCPHLECCVQPWSAHLQKDGVGLGKVQRKGTKMIRPGAVSRSGETERGWLGRCSLERRMLGRGEDRGADQVSRELVFTRPQDTRAGNEQAAGLNRTREALPMRGAGNVWSAWGGGRAQS